MNFCWKIKLFKKPHQIDMAQSDDEASQQYSLTPLTIDKEIVDKDGKSEENPAYQPITDIAKKIKEKDINNIALTGPYGSGKSSILKTLQKDYPQYNYLSISLATLECLDNSIEDDNENKNDNSTNSNEAYKKSKRDESLNRKIEYSILQQLIYKERIEDIPQSRFKRIRHISNAKSYAYSAGFVLLIISLCILFEPKFLKVQSLCNFFSCSSNWKIFWDILFSSYIIFFFIFTIKKIILNTYNNQINKLNFKNGEIEIKESTSIFNKHLDEIIYFFEVTKYNVVIIEDLDRFDTHNIFLKLRELNFLLNSSKAINRDLGKIVFVYAIRDDIFKDTSRTKFFDYISTVIPVINPSNSKDKLQNALKEKGINNISDDVCMDLGIYIDDMRILKNIVNEYIQYSHKLKRLSPRKMLGMILYKNYHPDDFANLHCQKGIVFNIISKKVKYHNSNIKEIDIEIKKLQEEKDKIINYHNNTTVKEIRTVYVMKYVEKLGLVQFFKKNRNDQEKYSINQVIADEDIFNKLINNEFNYYGNPWQASQPNQLKFKDIENEVDSNFSYSDRIIATPKRISQIDNRLKELEEETIRLRTLPLNKILQSYSADDFLKDVKDNRLIAFLIKSGYIAEDYYDYISYFYPGVIAPSDKEFILDLNINIPKDFDYKIYKTKATVNEIQESRFSQKEILNIDILDFLVKNKSKFSLKYNLIKTNIIKNLAFDFLQAYYKQGKESKDFFNDIFSIWITFFTKGIIDINDNEIRYSNFEMFLKFFPISKLSKFNNSEFKNFIASNYKFIAEKINIIGISTIESIIKPLDIKFNNIDTDVENSNEFINFIIYGFYFKLTSDNILNIFKLIYTNKLDDFINSSYSAIIDTNNSKLIEYIDNNIEYCITNIFSKTSIKESPESITKILNNKNIDNTIKNTYLSKQKNNISSFDKINSDYWDNAVICNIIEPTWKNVEKYISTSEENSEINEIVINFIAKNSKVLSEHKVSGILSENNDNKLFKKIFGSNSFPLESYEQLTKSFSRHWTSFDFSSFSEKRVKILIDNEKIEFNEYFYNQINKSFSNLLLSFIKLNKQTYLSNLDKYPLTSNLAIDILERSTFTKSEKIKIIEVIPENLFDGNNKLSNAVGNFIDSNSNIIVNKIILQKIIQECTPKDLKINLINKGCTELSYDKEFITLGLKSLGGDYALIAKQAGHRRKFKYTDSNKKLMVYLEKHKFISKQYEKDDNMINVNARNIK